jgi:IrrE N-terminal-like domain
VAAFLADRQIEAKAAELWRRHALAVRFDVEALLDTLELGTLWDRLDQGVFGALIPSKRLVIFNEYHVGDFNSNAGLYRFTASHEVGHWILHCEDDRANALALIPLDRTLCRQGSRDAVEVQAEKFAGYLLAPTDELKNRYPTDPWAGWPTVYRLAESFGMSVSAMLVRLKEAKLAYQDDAGVPRSGRKPIPGQLDLGLVPGEKLG